MSFQMHFLVIPDLSGSGGLFCFSSEENLQNQRLVLTCLDTEDLVCGTQGWRTPSEGPQSGTSLTGQATPAHLLWRASGLPAQLGT